MCQIKNYLLTVLENCSEENFGQEAVEWGLIQGHVTLTYDLTADLQAIMGLRSACCAAPPLGETDGRPLASGLCSKCQDHATFDRLYDQFVDAYQRQCREHGDALVNLYESAGLMEEILRPVSGPARSSRLAPRGSRPSHQPITLPPIPEYANS